MNINQPAHAPFVVLPMSNRRTLDRDETPPPRRLPGLNWMADPARNHLVAMIGEFAGTFLFLFFAFTGTQVANMSSIVRNAEDTTPHPDVLLYIALAFGFSLAVNVWVFFRISGGLFNPAVSTFIIE
jgi:aquaporin related protein